MTIPTKTMAIRLFEYGGPDKLIYDEYDLPPLGERDVLVKNHAGSVSRWDVKSGATPAWPHEDRTVRDLGIERL